MHEEHARTSDTIIELSGITRGFGGRFALSGVSLSVAAGEILGLIGPTGAGKTSLLRIVAGLDTPEAGEVRLSGREATRLRPDERGVAMVFQRDVYYPGRILEKDRREAERSGVFDRWSAAGITAAEVYRELEFDDRLFRQPPETLSGGQGRRASLLRAMFRDTPILLADEPLAGLDLWTRDRVARLMWRFVKATGKALIVVSHEPVEAIGLADRLAVLDQGRLVQCGTALELRNRPEHRVVVALLRYPPFNDVSHAIRSRSERIGPADSILVDPARCFVTPGGSPEGRGIAVRSLRQRWSAAGPFHEWIEDGTGAVLRTPEQRNGPEQGFFDWETGSELHFGPDGRRKVDD